jgi:glutathione peroxidase-family protein
MRKITDSLKFKIMTVLIFLVMSKAQSQTDKLYKIKVTTIDNKEIKLSGYTDRKLLVYICDVSNPDVADLKKLEVLYQQNKTRLSVVVVPVTDLNKGGYPSKFTTMLDTLKLSYVITQPTNGKKENKSAQNELLSYLTDKKQNNHFDDAITKPGEFFILSERGKLYARLKEGIPVEGAAMNKLIHKAIKD